VIAFPETYFRCTHYVIHYIITRLQGDLALRLSIDSSSKGLATSFLKIMKGFLKGASGG
jgi:hypothetical protein